MNITITATAAALALLVAACGLPPGPSDQDPSPAAPQRAVGCSVGTGYRLHATAYACNTSRSATAADLETACVSGWAPCAAPPAGCETLPAFFIGQLGWRPADGTDADAVCGAQPSPRTVQVGYGCGHGAQRVVNPRCGGYRLAADRPWGRGVLCCVSSSVPR